MKISLPAKNNLPYFQHAVTNKGSNAISKPAVPVLQQIKGNQNCGITHISYAALPIPVAQLRYKGHDSTANKKAIIEVLQHRENTIGLSEPEKVALQNFKIHNTIKKAFGHSNKTDKMRQGTAICHKIADSEISSTINEYFDSSIEELKEYLERMIEYINPLNNKSDNVPLGGNYEKKVNAAYNQAIINFNIIKKEKSITNTVKQAAHLIGGCVANSPINLFIGDQITNASIQANQDYNTAESGEMTPRSKRSKLEHDLGYEFVDKVSSRPGEELKLRDIGWHEEDDDEHELDEPEDLYSEDEDEDSEDEYSGKPQKKFDITHNKGNLLMPGGTI